MIASSDTPPAPAAARPSSDAPQIGALHAAIDIGTNSMHLVVARAHSDGGFDLLTTEKEMVRLGSGAREMKFLTPAAIERGLGALERMVRTARSLGVSDISIVATSAVREAENKQEFLDRASELVDVEVEVISGFEEARLIHLGVLQALPVFDKRRLVVDIGGGSTEFVIGERERALETRSLKLGAIRLTERFFPGGIAAPGAVEECRRYARNALVPMAIELSGHQPEVAIGSSGTIETVATMIAARRKEDIRQINGATFTKAELHDLVEALEQSTPASRKNMGGLEERRLDIIMGGAILLDEVFNALHIDEMVVSEYALREGVLLDRFGGAPHVGLDRLVDLRASNVQRLSRQLDPDPEHAFRTADLATQLFDRTARLHGLGRFEREILFSSAVVHNVGLFISHSSHHKHTYYVVRNSEHLTGFSEHEIELMALVARYHRKSHPSPKHAEFGHLSERDQYIVTVLAGLLRVAIGLDRRHAGVVRAVRVYVEDGESLTIEPVGDPGVDLDIEIYGATDRSSLLAKAFGLEVFIRQPEPLQTAELASS